MTAELAITFEPEGHTYTVEGAPTPSVSSILRSVQRFLPREAAEAGAARGILVHEACEAIDAGFEDDIDLSVEGFARGYRRFLADTGFRVTHSEYRVANPPCRYAGTIDRVGRMGLDTMIIDIKSGVTDSSMLMQLAAYQHAFWLMHSGMTDPLPKGAILSLKAEGDYRLIESSEPEEAFAAFLGLARYHRWKEKVA